ncbi:serine-enriched protein [Gigaspora margarita]|uniref:Serine-enriched protein n=1 Tax=Gigaspora margarita TaxID=4874 RepID=A0A8H3XHV1_GIGMA|nr:serine-enriched protein [Gigaspora margarita]
MITELFSGLSQDFGRLLDNADDYNVIIEIGDGPNVKKFQAHSVVLRARSPYFHTALSSDWLRRENGYIVFKQLGVSSTIFSAIIKYMYNGTMLLDDDTDIFELLAAADQFSLHELLSHIQSHLILKRSDWIRQNLVKILHLSLKHKTYQDLYNFCNRLIVEDARSLFEAKDFTSIHEDVLVSVLQRDDLGLNEAEIWDKVIKWGITNTKNITASDVSSWRKEDFSALQKTINRLIPLIRLFQMTPTDYCHKVRPYKKLLSKNLQDDLLHYYLANDTPKSSTILPPRIAPIQIDSVMIGPQHTALIARWIDNESTIKQGVQYHFSLLFRASRDGYSINPLKQKCSDKGPVVIVLKVRDSGKLIGGYNSIGWKTEKLSSGQGTSDSFVFTLGDGRSPDGAKIARVTSSAAIDKDVDDLAWHGPRFGKGPDLWVRMNSDQSGEARKDTYESSIMDTEGRFRWTDCEIFSVVKK